MGKLIKIMINNIKANFGRSLIIIITLIISIISLYSTFNFKQLLIENEISTAREKEVGKSNYVITNTGDNDIISRNKEEEDKVFDKAIGLLASGASIRKDDKLYKFELVGVNVEDFKDVFNYELYEGNDDLETGEAVINERISKEQSLNIGDDFSVFINGSELKLKIKGIAKDSYMFAGGDGARILIDKSTLLSRYNLPDNFVNRIYVIDSDKSIDSVRDKAKDIYNEYSNLSVDESIDYTSINSDVNSYSSMLYIILVFVLIISALIIYSTYRTILVKRLSFVGTLKAIGVKDIKIYILHNLEALVYSCISLSIGLVSAYMINSSILSSFKKSLLEYEMVNNDEVIGILLCCLIIFLIMQSIVILGQASINKLSIRQLLFDEEFEEKENILIRLIGSIIFVVIFVFSFKVNRDYSMLIQCTCLISAIIALKLFMDTILFAMHKLMEKMKCKSILYASFRNILANKSMNKNVSLLAIGGMAVMIISVFAYSTAVSMSSFYKEYNCDLMMSSKDVSDYKMNVIKTDENVSDFCAYNNVKVKLNDENFVSCRVIDDIDEFSKFYSLNLKEENKNNFEDGKNVIITKIYAERYNLKVGDTVELKAKASNKEYEYKIYNISDSMINMGATVYIPSKFGNDDFNLTMKNAFLLNSNDPEECEKSLGMYFNSEDDDISIIQDRLERDAKNSKMIFNLFYIFACLASLIGVIGIINNLALSIIVRKKEFAIYKSIGVGTSKTIKMLFLEGILVGVLGGAAAIIGTLTITPFIGGIIFYLGLPIEATIAGKEFYLVFILIVLISFIPILFSLKGILRRNVLDDLRCE